MNTEQPTPTEADPEGAVREAEEDLRVRERIPCVTVVLPPSSRFYPTVFALPEGYSVVFGDGDRYVYYRGLQIPWNGEVIKTAWDHAVARVRAKREAEGTMEEQSVRLRNELGDALWQRDEARAALESANQYLADALRHIESVRERVQDVLVHKCLEPSWRDHGMARSPQGRYVRVEDVLQAVGLHGGKEEP